MARVTETGQVFPDFNEAMKCHRTWHLWINVILTASYGLFFAGNFKAIATFDNDSFLTLIGSLGSVANGGCRWVWGMTQDRFGFKVVYYSCLAINIVTASTFPFI